MRLSCGTRGLAFFAVIIGSFILGSAFGAAVCFFSSAAVMPGDSDFIASGFISVFIGLLAFPLAAFFLGFSASGVLLIPVLSVLRGFSAALCAYYMLGFFGFGSAYWIFFAASAASCSVFITFAFFALRSSSCIIQKLFIPELKSSSGFGEYIKSSALLFAIIFAIGALEFFSVPLFI